MLSESDSSNIDNEADGTTRLFLLDCDSETIGAGITEQAERSRLGDHFASQSGKAKGRWGCEFRKESVDGVSYCGLSRFVIGGMRRAMLGRGLR